MSLPTFQVLDKRKLVHAVEEKNAMNKRWCNGKSILLVIILLFTLISLGGEKTVQAIPIKDPEIGDNVGYHEKNGMVSIIGASSSESFSAVEGTIWYVAKTGDNTNDCLSTITPCATIQAALDKAAADDKVYVAGGIYTGTGDEVILIKKISQSQVDGMLIFLPKQRPPWFMVKMEGVGSPAWLRAT